jgi:hypothetical protein
MNANPAVSIVPVHGGFVDGSGRRPLYELLTQDGYRVAASHSVYVSQPAAVADFIKEAVSAIAARQ